MCERTTKRNTDRNIKSTDIKSNTVQHTEFSWQDCFNLLINNPLQELLFISKLLDISNCNKNERINK